MRKIIFILLLILSVTTISKAQSSYVSHSIKNDSIECLKAISVYKEFQKLKFTDNAIEQWEKTYKRCPGFKKIIYQDGVKFLRYLIKKENDKQVKKKLVDSLMHIYDARIKYFGQEAYLKGKKGLDLYRYDRSRIEESRQFLFESKEELAEKTSPSVLNTLMITTEKLYRKKKLSDTTVVRTYLSVVEILEKQLKNANDSKKLKRIKTAISSIEKVFSQSKAASCDNLEPAFTKIFYKDSTNIELIVKIQLLLKGAKCIHSDLYYITALKLHQLKPNASNAYILAGLSLKKEQYNEVSNYLLQAIEMEDSDSLKAQYYLDLATIYTNRLKKYKQARSYAYEAINLRENWGKPYLLIGDIYVAYSKNYGKNDFEHSTVYWLAVDQYKKAKNIDSNLTGKANEKIEYYQEYFPTTEDVFFNGLAKGKSYKIADWINETTTVKTRE